MKIDIHEYTWYINAYLVLDTHIQKSRGRGGRKNTSEKEKRQDTVARYNVFKGKYNISTSNLNKISNDLNYNALSN